MGAVMVVFVIVSLPMFIGDAIAWPLERHRHKNFPIWFTWTMLRLSIPVAIITLCVIFLVRRLLFA